MTCNILESGSSGNGTIVFDSILIDCGIAFHKIAPYLKQIQLVLLTHEHSDHFRPSTVKMLHQMRPTVRFACCEWMAKQVVEAGVKPENIDVIESGKEVRYLFQTSFVFVKPIKIPHNVPNCAWCIVNGTNILRGNSSVFYATDCSSLDGIMVKNYDLYLIECNHYEDEIKARIEEKQERGEYAYEIEACRNHLSWEQAMSWLAENGPDGKFIPMHQHRDKE